jgi:hypothetical protein
MSRSLITRFALATGVAATLVVIAILLRVTGFLYPLPTGETIVATLLLEVRTGETSAIREFMAEFARVEGLTIADDTDRMPTRFGKPVINLSLSYADSTEVIAAVGNTIVPDHVLVGLYERTPNPDFAGLASRLTAALTERWPSTAPYLGP